MINLLAYRDQAEYPSAAGEPARSGREAYQHYASLALGTITVAAVI